MDDCDNVDLLLFDAINNPVRALNDFPDLWMIGFWYDAARVWKSANLF